jgi:hypothetical protein
MTMTESILERQLGVFFAHGGKKPKDIVEQIVGAIRHKLLTANRILMMPGGIFAAELAQRLSDLGFSIVAFADNFKEEGLAIFTSAKIIKPAAARDMDFDVVLIATPSIPAQEAMREQLVEIMPERSRDVHVLLDIISDTFDDSIKSTARRIRKRMAAFSEGKRICITSPFLHHNYLKLMRHLKMEGFNVTVLTGHKLMNSAISIDEFQDNGFFDSCHVIYSYDVVMPRLLKSLEFDLIHAIVTTASPISIARAVKEKRCPFIVDYCDFKEILFENKEDYLRTMTLKEFFREKDAWESIFTESDGVIIKDSPEIIDILSKKYNKTPRLWMQFMSYPSKKFIPKEINFCEKISEKDDRFRIVYAGCVNNNPVCHPYPHHKSLLEIAKSLNSQGISFTIINAMDNCGDGFDEYIRLSKQLPLFDYRFAVPQDQLAAELSKFDIGWFAFDLSNARESVFFLKTTFGSKIFNYMEAGLPILVSKELEYMCKWIEEKGIGKGIHFSELNRIEEIIENMEIHKMRKNIKRLLHELCFEREIGSLLEFYGNVGAHLKVQKCKKDLTYVH